MVAERYQTRHHVEQVDPDDFSLVDRLAVLYDEPYADSSAIPTYRVCELARKTVTVALSGDGGDESFGGYRRYRWHVNEERVRSRLPLQLRRPVFGLLGQLYPKADWAPRVFRAKSTFEALARNSVEAYFHSVSILHDAMRGKLFSARFRSELQGYAAVEVLKRHAARAPSDHPLSLVQYLDLKTYLVGDINTKVDRASMAHSLEVREPLMDHPLVEWLSSLPPDFKLRNGEGKYLLKKALEPYLPAGNSLSAEDGLCGSPRQVVPGAAARVGEGRSARAGARRYRLVQRAPTCAGWWRTTSRACATTARRCGRCSCSSHSCAT